LDRAVGDRVVNFALVAISDDLGFAVVIELEDGAVATDAETAADASVLIDFRFLISHCDFLQKSSAIIKGTLWKGNYASFLSCGFKKHLYSFRISAMETRMEKYKKYREEIALMADESFPQFQGKTSFLNEKDGVMGGDSLPKKCSPYYLYAKRLRKRPIILLIIFLLFAIGFAVWFNFLQGRKV
jgi:hypothetical protein